MSAESSPDQIAQPFQTIVVGTDGSSTAAVAVQTAIGLAASASATLHIVSAYDDQAGSQMQQERRESPRDIRWSVTPKHTAEAVVREATERAAAAGVEVVGHEIVGGPAETILDVADEVAASLIVVGNKGMNGVQRFLLGSVPNKISHHAPCSVLVVRTT